MYNKAISQLEKEVKERKELIDNIKNFESIGLSEKIQAIKNSTLRCERDTMPEIIQKEFKSDLLKNGEAHIGVNYFYIKVENYTFFVGLFGGKTIEIENEKKISRTKDVEVNEDKLYDKIYYDSKEAVSIMDEFLLNPSFSNYKKALARMYKKTSSIYSLNYFINRKLAKELVQNRKDDFESFIRQREQQVKENKANIEKDNMLKQENEQFLLDIKSDLDYFEENGYRVILRFNKK